MDAQQLRAIQAPLKDEYRSRPQAASITLKASGRLGDENISCRVETGKALVEAGLHPATGGDGTLACSGDMLLEALVACAGVTLKAVSTALGITVRAGTVNAEAISISAVPSAWTNKRRSGFPLSACVSISTPTRRRSNWKN